MREAVWDIRTLLSPYRVLDLTNETGFMCGKMLADLGADVIKVERPGGDDSRKIGPFYNNISDSQKSLYWFAYNTNKRGITLDIESLAGRNIFRTLVGKADFILETYAPGYLDKLELSYSSLKVLNPKLIMVSITPFGQTGPYKDRKGADIVHMAEGGLMYITGDPDRPPLRMGGNQSHFLAGIHAAAGALIAHYYRMLTGQGQHVDISIQEAVLRFGYSILPWIAGRGISETRRGNVVLRGNAYQRDVWSCKDGYVLWRFMGGIWGVQDWTALVKWIDEKGKAGILKEVDWATIDMSKLSQAEVDSWNNIVQDFFNDHTKDEIQNEALKRGLKILKVYSPKDVFESSHLQSRGYWTHIEHPELNRSITYPAFIFLSNETSCAVNRRAPLIGEHNDQIYKKDIGLSLLEAEKLKKDCII